MKTKHVFKGVAIGLLATMGSLIYAQQISVNVNGSPVTFQYAQPRMYGDRVMVPMRDIFEQLGAAVDWNPASRQVTASKSGTEVVLLIGSKYATLNGSQVSLDVPAMIVAGTTMVPLRFISESLGAAVDWNEASDTVAINMPADNSGSQTVSTTQNLAVDTMAGMPLKFTDNAGGWVNSGAIHFTLDGPQGGQAAVVMPGLSTEVPMTETTPGHYEADWSVQSVSAPMSIQEGSAMARLSLNGKQYYSTTLNNLSVDTSPPTLNSQYPTPDSVVSGFKPAITVNYDDYGSGIDPNKVQMRFNGDDVTSSAQITPRSATYALDHDLTPGAYTADVTLVDKAGNAVTKHWSFSVTGTSTSSDFTHNGNGTILPGQVVHYSLRAAPGSQVTVMAGRRVSLPLTETSPGVFSGDYSVRDRDFFGGDLVTATIVPPNGQQYMIQSPISMGVSGNISPAKMAPVITSPLASQHMTDPITISGSTLAGATVLITISYETVLGPHSIVHGSLADLEVTADNAGNYQTQPIHIGYNGYGNSTTYRVSAVTVLPDGRRSDATVLRIPQ